MLILPDSRLHGRLLRFADSINHVLGPVLLHHLALPGGMSEEPLVLTVAGAAPGERDLFLTALAMRLTTWLAIGQVC
jgi:hypothetical protein